MRETIHERMKSLGMSQRELERRSGVHFVTISRLLSGDIEPEWPTLSKILDALGGGHWVWGKKPKPIVHCTEGRERHRFENDVCKYCGTPR